MSSTCSRAKDGGFHIADTLAFGQVKDGGFHIADTLAFGQVAGRTAAAPPANTSDLEEISASSVG
ncbi:hypothetical protein OG884_22550 [Streptosporangium sp. NBC_01755]|uniref:hypothetical protein n=1 Tax=Streptosporangium sp. NBC_01755 TaxID=2975949 RepID=UPI002DDAC261|nr:hypothetical protein [Streptosporangium sp. NBC_01755]WSC97669.1 hypothetical protein OG884_22550 [Streptosporangium sp. NBC_01755]